MGQQHRASLEKKRSREILEKLELTEWPKSFEEILNRLRRLDSRKAEAFARYYGLDAHMPHFDHEVGSALHIKHSSARALRMEAVQMLRKLIRTPMKTGLDPHAALRMNIEDFFTDERAIAARVSVELIHRFLNCAGFEWAGFDGSGWRRPGRLNGIPVLRILQNTKTELLRWPNMGPHTLEAVQKVLATAGIPSEGWGTAQFNNPEMG
jgi:hypothetical protein